MCIGAFDDGQRKEAVMLQFKHPVACIKRGRNSDERHGAPRREHEPNIRRPPSHAPCLPPAHAVVASRWRLVMGSADTPSRPHGRRGCCSGRCLGPVCQGVGTWGREPGRAAGPHSPGRLIAESLGETAPQVLNAQKRFSSSSGRALSAAATFVLKKRSAGTSIASDCFVKG